MGLESPSTKAAQIEKLITFYRIYSQQLYTELTEAEPEADSNNVAISRRAILQRSRFRSNRFLFWRFSMFKLIPGALFAASLGLIGITAPVQTAPAQAVLSTLKSPLSSSPASPLPSSIPSVPASSPPSAPASSLPSLILSAPLPSPILPAPISTLPVETTATATAGVVAGVNHVEGKVAENTVSTVGNLAGASTDSRTGVGLNLPTNSDQVETSAKEFVEKPLDHSGTASVVVSGSKDQSEGDAGVDLTVEAGNLAVARICLDGDASIGRAGDKSLADCKTDRPKPQTVPEPSVIGSLALMGAYFVARHRRSKTATAR